MARIRTIKPQFFTNDDLAEMAPLARLLFVGLWCVADREGRLEDRPKKIKAELLPYDDADVDRMLDDLEAGGFIRRYTVDDTKLIQVINFGKHQHCHIKEPPSSLPPPPDPGPGRAPGKHHTDRVLIRQEGKGREHVREQEGERAENCVFAPAPVEVVTHAPEPNARHPAIQAVREIIHRYPNKALYGPIVEALGVDFDVGRLRECGTAWLARGFNPVNLAWLFEWYVNGEIPDGQSKVQSANERNFAGCLKLIAG